MLGYIEYGWTALLFTIKMRSVVLEAEEAACEKGGAECYRREAAENSITSYTTRAAGLQNAHTFSAHYDTMKGAEGSLLNRKRARRRRRRLVLHRIVFPSKVVG